MRLDQWLLHRAKWPWSLVQKSIRKQSVHIESLSNPPSGYKLCPGDVILLPASVTIPGNAESDPNLASKFASWILAETSDHIVINKPKGLAAQGGVHIKTSVDIIAKSYCETARIMHRLDKDTSGLLAIAKSREGCSAELSEKQYLGVVEGWPDIDQGEIQRPILGENGAKEAKTRYNVVGKGQWKEEKVALVKFGLYTGRKHQIRLHAALDLQCPLLGDAKYSKSPLFSYFFLHSFKFRLGGIEYTAPVPAPFQSFLSTILGPSFLI